MASRTQYSEYLATSDVARIARVTPEAVRKWVRLGRLPVAVQAQSGVRFYRRRDVEALIAARNGRRGGGGSRGQRSD